MKCPSFLQRIQFKFLLSIPKRWSPWNLGASLSSALSSLHPEDHQIPSSLPPCFPWDAIIYFLDTSPWFSNLPITTDFGNLTMSPPNTTSHCPTGSKFGFCLACPDLSVLGTLPFILCSSNVRLLTVLCAVSYSHDATSDIVSVDRYPSSPILVHPPESYWLILKNLSPTRASSDLPLVSLPTPPAFCFDTTLYTFLCWYISCLIDLSICLWVCLLYLRVNY